MLSKVSVGFMTGDPSAGLSSEASCAVVSTLRGIEHAELATWLHHHYVEPFLLQHQSTIDSQARELFKSVKDARWEEWSLMLRGYAAGLMGTEVRAPAPAQLRAPTTRAC